MCNDVIRTDSSEDLYGRYSASLIRESKMTFYVNSNDGSIHNRKNVCKELGLGQYLADQWRVNKMWNEVLNIIEIMNEQPAEIPSSEFYLRKRTISGYMVVSQSELKYRDKEENIGI